MNLLVVGISVILFIVACLCPAYTLSGTEQTPGWACLVFGWMSIFSNPLQAVIWCANIAYLFALQCALFKPIAKEGFQWDVLIAILALVIGLSFLFKKTIDGDTHEAITSLNAGYWLWISSFTVLAFYKCWTWFHS